MFRQVVALLAFALCLGPSVTAAQAPTDAQARSGEMYLWHGEVVSIQGGSLTVKARLLSQAADEVDRFSAGDRVLLTWSGQGIHAGAIRGISQYTEGQRLVEFFAMPAELASLDVQGDMLTFRIPVPNDAAMAIKAVMPGEWVTVTARQRPADPSMVAASVRPYVNPQN